MSRLILASQSPRRKELLAAMGLEFDIIPSTYDEKLDDARSPEEVAIELGLGKALQVAADYPDSFVIGSDTIVTVDGKQLEKPRDKADAYAML
ncbi:MAG: Septum formation protein Maf, partial [Candidatus Saccharibacteria bacterium]|nr:Septum formation protein Maf [Candidatus Saccharibacteria bacterium]